MALLIPYRSPELGIVFCYHRISSITQTTNEWAQLQVCSYLSKEDREIELNETAKVNSIANYEPIKVFTSVDYFMCSYMDGMTCTDAYNFLKTQDQFKGAEDVLEEDDEDL